MNNAIFIMTNTKFKKKINSKLYQNIKISLAKYQSKNRKRTYIEFYGETKAKQIKEKLSLSHKGKVSNMKGKKHSEAAKAKMRKKHKKLNLECRKLHSEIVKNLWKNPKIREKLCKNRKGRKCSEETKIKMKLAWIKRKANHND